MRETIGTVLFLIVIGASLALSVYGHLPERPAASRRFDIAAARRESHSLGLPFPESDGTLSFPPEPKLTPEQVHAQIHARRMIAQFGVTSEEALDAAYEALYGDRDLR